MKRTARGFSFIEVMIALLILSIILTAVMSGIREYTRHLAALQQKTTAHWVAFNLLNACQAGFHPLTEPSGQTVLLNKTWRWTLEKKYLPTLHATRLDARVYVDNSKEMLATATAFLPDREP